MLLTGVGPSGRGGPGGSCIVASLTQSTYNTTRSGRSVAFCNSEAWRWDAKTGTLINVFAQLKVRMNRSSVDGAIFEPPAESIEVDGRLNPRSIFER